MKITFLNKSWNAALGIKAIMRISSLLIIPALVVTSFLALQVPLLAAGSAGLSGPSSVEPGDTGSISVSVASSPKNIGSFQLDVSCSDSAAIRFTGISAGALSSAVNYTADSASMNWFTSGSGSSGGDVATISFSVVGAAGTSASISLSGTLYDATADALVINSVSSNLTINIVAPPPPPPPPPTTTAPPVIRYNLTVQHTGNGTTSPDTGTYATDEGNGIDITATPAAGWQFQNWTGAVVNTSSAVTRVLMDSDKTVIANFIQIPTTTTTTPPTTTTVPPTTTTTTPPTTSTAPPTTTTTPPTTSTAPPTTTTTPPPTTSTAPPTTTTTPPPTTSTAPPKTTAKPPTTTISPPITTTIDGVETVLPGIVTVSQDVTANTDINGKFIAPVALATAGGDAAITIAAGITGTGSDGKPLTSIAIAKLLNPPSPPPTGQNIVSTVYEFGPSGAHFSTPIKITLQYFPVAGIDDSNLVIAYYSVSDGKWITLGGVVNSVLHTVTIEVDHFTAFTVFELPKNGTAPVSGATLAWWLLAVIGSGLFVIGLISGLGIAASGRRHSPKPPVAKVEPVSQKPRFVPVAQPSKPAVQSSIEPFAPKPPVQPITEPPVAKTIQNTEVTPVKPPEQAKSPEIAERRDAPLPVSKPVEAPKTAGGYNEITVKLTKGDFTLTAAAAAKLSASSQNIDGGEPRVLRITRLPGTPVQLRMFIDKQSPDDIVVLNNGVKVLFLSSEAAEMLGGIVIDFQTTANGGEYALSKKKPV